MYEEKGITNICTEDEDLISDITQDEDEDEDGCEEFAEYVPILKSVNLNSLPDFATSIRKQNAVSGTNPASTDTDTESSQLACKLILPALFGSYNILFPLEFSDGIRWLCKVPITGYKGQYDELAAKALTSEAMTMRLLRRQTTIPVPEVYSFDSSLDNDINCPFIMMEYLSGRPLHELWFQPSSPQSKVEQFRKRVLQELAAAMAQLNAFTFDQGGSLLFDNEGNVAGVGASKVADMATQYDKLFHDEGYDGFPIFCSKGPFNDAKSFLKFSLDRHGPLEAAPVKLHKGVHKLLRKFIDWTPCDSSTKTAQFVLTHPDYAFQNVLVSEDGALQGIIDWDGAAAVPCWVGQYPLFLMRDWDPSTYNYDVKAGRLCDPDGRLEDNPEQLRNYRELYAQLMEVSLSRLESRNGKFEVEVDPGLLSNELSHPIIRKSILGWSLAVAADDSSSRNGIMHILFEEIDRLTAIDRRNADSAANSEAPGDNEVYSDVRSNIVEEITGNPDKIPTQDKLRDTSAQAKNNNAGKEMGSTESGDNALCNSSLAANSTASSDERVRSDMSINSTKGTSAYTDELHRHNGLKIAEGPTEGGRGGQDAQFTGVGSDAAPKCLTSMPIAYEDSTMGTIKPICYRIRDAFRYNGKVLYQKNSNKAPKDVEPLQAVVQPAIAKACPNKSAQPRGYRIQGALEHTVQLLHGKRSKASATDTRSRSTDAEVCTDGIGEAHSGSLGKAFHITTKLLHKQKAKKSAKDTTEAQSKPIEGRSSKHTKSFSARMRSAFQKTINLLRNKKSKEPSTTSESSPALVERCTNVAPEPSLGGVSSLHQQSSPDLPKDSPSQGSLGLAEGTVEKVCDHVHQQLEPAFATMSQENRAFVELVIRKGVQSLKNGIPSGNEILPGSEVLESSEVVDAEAATPTDDEAPSNSKAPSNDEIPSADDAHINTVASAPTTVEKEDKKQSVFSLWTVAHEIADDELSEEKWQRLHRGFLALWDSL